MHVIEDQIASFFAEGSFSLLKLLISANFNLDAVLRATSVLLFLVVNVVVDIWVFLQEPYLLK